MTKSSVKKNPFFIIFSIILILSSLFIGQFIKMPANILNYVKALIFFLSWFFAGFYTLKQFFISVKNRNLNEYFLVAFASFMYILIGKFVIAALIMIIYELGTYIINVIVKKVDKAVKKFAYSEPKFANVERDGKLEKVHPEEIMIGDNVVVKKGEIVPVDGVVIAGESEISISSLIGRNIKKNIQAGNSVLCGSRNNTGILKITAEKFYLESVFKLLKDIVDNAREHISQSEVHLKKFASVYMWVMFILSLLIFWIPFILDIKSGIKVTGLQYFKFWDFLTIHFPKHINISMTFVLAALPSCFYLFVSPLFFAGVCLASKFGIYLKTEYHLDILSKVNTVVFNKTGILTKSNYKVTNVVLASNTTDEEFKNTILQIEKSSSHPIAQAIKSYYQIPNINETIMNTSVIEIPNKGLWLVEDGNEILVGNKELMIDYKISFFENNLSGIKIYTAKNKKFLGCIVIRDEINPTAKAAAVKLKEINVKPVMITGDTNENAENIASQVGISNYYAGLLKEEKLLKIKALISSNKNNRQKVVYVGDGINDEAILNMSDAGVLINSLKSIDKKNSAELLIADDNLLSVVLSLHIARKIALIFKTNLFVVLSAKILLLLICYFVNIKFNIPYINLLILVVDLILTVVTILISGFSLRTLQDFCRAWRK